LAERARRASSEQSAFARAEPTATILLAAADPLDCQKL
jgi:hypothetical protein